MNIANYIRQMNNTKFVQTQNLASLQTTINNIEP